MLGWGRGRGKSLLKHQTSVRYVYSALSLGNFNLSWSLCVSMTWLFLCSLKLWEKNPTWMFVYSEERKWNSCCIMRITKWTCFNQKGRISVALWRAFFRITRNSSTLLFQESCQIELFLGNTSWGEAWC